MRICCDVKLWTICFVKIVYVSIIEDNGEQIFFGCSLKQFGSGENRNFGTSASGSPKIGGCPPKKNSLAVSTDYYLSRGGRGWGGCQPKAW